MPIIHQSALQLAAQLHNKTLRVAEVLDALFAHIARQEPQCNGYIHLCQTQAYAAAETVQAHLDAGDVRSPLAGVPVAVKDLICTKGVATTCASRMLQGFVPPYDAAVMERLYAGDLLLLGKTNMDEFAMGSTTETSAFGATRNPHNPEHVPGGSSGGSAAVLAAFEAPLALGSDTGGSIRQPASYCGVVGLKPTYGAVSRYGLIAYASSLDQIGPMARNSADCAALFALLKGKDARDSTSMERQAPVVPLKGLRVGVPAEFLGDGLQAEIYAAVQTTLERLKSLGAVVVETSLPLAQYAIPTYYILACAEACSNLSRYDGIKYGHRSATARSLHETYVLSRTEGFGLEVKRRIMLGNFVLSSGYFDAYYRKASQARRLIQAGFESAFAHCDVLLAPVSPTTAPRLNQSLQDPLQMYLSDVYTVMVNIAGLPALALPCGKDTNGLPVGLQLIGTPFAEDTLLQTAQALEDEAPC